MLGVSSHAWKVNFCKFTNETRNGLEDSSKYDGLKFLAAVNGSCAGGGYELALACDEIILIDDRSSAVSLPEVPLLGVLPGTGGLTRLTDKRHVRHDLADVFCTTSEGVRGEKALDWRLVDAIAKPAQFAAKVKERALALAAISDRPASARGVALTPIERAIEADALTLFARQGHNRPERARRNLRDQGPERAPQPQDVAAIEAEGADWYPLALARELDDAILSMRTNELDIGMWLMRTEGELEAVLAMDATLRALKQHWFVRETIGYLRRTLSRLDITSRSLFALVDEGSCFAGTLFEMALACDRIYHLALPAGEARAPRIAVSEANFGDYPMASGQSRVGRRFYDERPALEQLKAGVGKPLEADAAFALGLATSIPDDIDWADEIRIAVEERASMSPDALTAMEANLRFNGPENSGHARLRPPYRLAELDLPASQRGRRQGRAQGLRQGRKGRVRLEPGVMDASEAEVIRQHLIDPEICIRCNTCESTCPVGAITHDTRNYVVDANICNLCMACVPPCPTGSIDNWRSMPRSRAYSIEAQFGWDALPAELSAGELGAAGASGEALAAAAASRAAPSGASEEAAFDVSAYAAVIPPWSAASPYASLYGPKAAARSVAATVVGNVRVTEVGKDYDTHHIVLDFGAMPFPVLEGQSIGVIPPGVDADGRPRHPRRYSVASPRNGERPGYNNVSLTVKRVLEDHQGRSVRGVVSNYLCDLAVGDKVEVTGPFGVSFLMPNHPKSAIVMICTGTGSAPMRAMTEWRRRLRKSGKFEGGKLMLFFGARTRQELPYFGPLGNLPKDFIDINFAFSRTPGQPKRYVQDVMRERAADLSALIADPDAYFYVCGLKAMEEGVVLALRDIALQAGLDWGTVGPSLKRHGRLHLETY